MPTFVVLAHRAPQQLTRLSSHLGPHPVVVHVDAAQDIAPFVAGAPGNVQFVEDRVRVHWGGFSVVQATLNALAHAVTQTEPEDHVVLLSGECYPIRPIAELTEHLASAPYRQHIRAALVFDGDDYSSRRLSRQWFYDVIPHERDARTRALRSGARKVLTTLAPHRDQSFFAPYLPVAGSQWVALTAECVLDVLAMADAPTRKKFRRATAPDEIFLHTLVHSSKWAEQSATPVPMPRAGRRTSEFANLHHLDHTQQRPWRASDLDELLRSEKFFVRKVGDPETLELLDLIDQRL